MDKTDKIIITLMISLMLGIGYIVVLVDNEIKEQGGFRQIVIDTGKEVKEIVREIEKD